MKKRVLALLLMVVMVVSLVGCKGKTEDTEQDTTTTEDTTTSDSATEEVPDKVVASGQYDTLVVGTQTFNGVFSPMFSQNAYDVQAYDPIFTSVMILDKDGVLIDDAGHIEAKEVPAESDGHTQVEYTVTVKEGMVFSDGTPITIDDVLFYYYVLADPTYDGSSTFSTLDIVGMKEYYYDTPEYSAKIDEITANVAATYAADVISEEDFKTYLRESNLAGWYEGPESYDWLGYLEGEGYDISALSLDNEETLIEALVTCEYEKYAAYYDPQTWWQDKKEAEFITGNVEDGIDVEEISGIKKVDDYTCTVLFDSINIYGDRELAAAIVPKHYYGASFVKGDLSSVKALNGAPMGAGPYKFVSYQDNIVTLEANTKYFGEIAKIPYIKFQVIAEADKVDAVLTDQIDVTDPSASQDVIDAVTSAGDSYSLVDNPGYGYIAIDAANVPDINVRKGLMHLMNRGPAVEAYYGELAEVIERPMTPTVAEYPKDATEMYGYDPAKALEYFTTAGYAKDADGKLSKDGEQLVISVGIGGSGTMDHPSAPILTQMTNDLASMGAELVIHDVDFSTLVNMKDAGELDMWVMAWGNSYSCDLTQLYGSQSDDNDVHIYSEELDALMAEALKTVDFDARCEIVAKELDIVMDYAVVMPVYQRKNMEIYNASTIKLETLPTETTTYWNYAKQIYKLEMQ